MSSDEFSPDLSNLAKDYEIVSELRQSPVARTFLARYRKLNRDVTVTVVRMPARDKNALTHFASDARMLSVMRHRNLVPVIEGRWIPGGAFAIVRARVRGTTLEEVIGENGALPEARVASTLEQVQAALEWARNNGIMNRGVSASSVVFQQGSGRVMLELEPTGPSGVPDACDDAHTMGQLSLEMLSGTLGAGADTALGEVRPDLSAAVVRETKALVRCSYSDGLLDATALIALLRGGSLAPPIPDSRDDDLDIQLGPLDSAIAVVKRPFGFNARLGSAMVLVAAVSVLGVDLLRRRGELLNGQPPAPVASSSAAAAGEVSFPRSPSPELDTPTPPASRTATPTATAPKSSGAKAASSSTDVGRRERERRPVAPPDTHRQAAALVFPLPAAPPRRSVSRLEVPGNVFVIPQDSNTGTARDSLAFDTCDSTEPINQQRCFIAEVEKTDRPLNGTYERMITALRHRASAQPNDPDPASVDSLRRVQQRWLEWRESMCRGVGGAPLFARARAQCYADLTAKRAGDLSAHLATAPGAPRDTSKP